MKLSKLLLTTSVLSSLLVAHLAKAECTADAQSIAQAKADVAQIIDPAVSNRTKAILGARLNRPDNPVLNCFDMLDYYSVLGKQYVAGGNRESQFKSSEIKALGIKPAELDPHVLFDAIHTCNEDLIDFMMQDPSIGFASNRKIDQITNSMANWSTETGSALVAAASLGCVPALKYAVQNPAATEAEFLMAIRSASFEKHADAIRTINESGKIKLGSNPDSFEMLGEAMLSMDQPDGVAVIQELIACGINPNAKIDKYWNPATILKKHYKEYKSYEAVKEIFQSVR